MRFKIKAWLKAKLSFRGSSIPYEEFQDERGSTSEEVKIEPPISPTNCYGHILVISASICIASHVSGCLDYKISHISHCLDTIKYTYSAAIQWLLGLQVWSYQLLHFSGCLDYKFGHISHCFSVAVWTKVKLHQPYRTPSNVLQRCSTVPVWTTSLVASVAAWTPSKVLTVLLFSCSLDYKFNHINHCLDTIQCFYSAALQWLFGFKLLYHIGCPF
ncbi:hypothetical protein TNIN_146681 [Trichonephila inaurata madagascariensis]|uniref:Uncharacterized protein n=1 Tax=Trichonephila inaurata madagascariensis TaxID=2747483 RepID=A0A8X6Y6X7_9ARAC|nr:hypothetical protein TNIN_146681 [Trichonephila inaurata madagascariensis]